ncbi:ATP-binding protein [Fodinicurvata sp. EGI_FJ10296]|uniref:ATP-binding protein n=1 Tax=Fodinicurvata sp. EGI_FJ10296 TaxID=3231908 RepID=UPI0034522350
MPRSVIRHSRFLAIIALVSTPAAIVLLALVAFAGLALHHALSGLAVIAVATAGILHVYFRDAEKIARQLDRLGAPGAPLPVRPPRPESDTGRAIFAAVAGLQRQLRARNRAMELEAAAGRSIVESLDDPVVVITADRRIARVNPAATSLYGARLVGRDVGERLRNPRILAAIDRVFSGGPAEELEYTEPVPVERAFDIRIKPFPVTIDPMIGIDGTGPVEAVPAVLVMVHDVTAALRTDRMRADFIANVSHELRTPLATLAGFIETLSGPARDDSAARERFLAIMQQQTDRMARLVQDLLSLSRIEVEEHAQPRKPVDVSAILSRVIQSLEMKAADRHSRIVLDMPDELPKVGGDDDQLSQVFQNLIDNAIKYGRPETDVEVTVAVEDDTAPVLIPAAARAANSAPGRRLRVTVRDHGEGIDRVHLPRLTERFYRVDPARSRAAGGTGLGLAIVKHIISRHRGRLVIDSVVGEGSTFSVLLPGAGRPVPVTRPESVRPAEPAIVQRRNATTAAE